MSWISYAQNREDVLLNRLFGDRASGFFIDVGALDPVNSSITKHFSDMGWRGINIDASPVVHGKFLAARPMDRNLHLGVSNHEGTMRFFRCVFGPGTADPGGLSTFEEAEVERHKKQGFRFEALDVPVKTLASICEENVKGEIDFLTVDVEGHERAVLEGADFKRFAPRAVLVEATRPLSKEQTHDAWESILTSAGYVFATFDGLNRFYLREDMADKKPLLSVAPNVFDDFVPWPQERAERELSKLEGRYAILESARNLVRRVTRRGQR